jgi:hypothetical protein
MFTGLPTAAHFVYIPCVLLVGIVLGWILGGRAARDFYEGERRKQEERERRQAERAARTGTPGAEPGSPAQKS